MAALGDVAEAYPDRLRVAALWVERAAVPLPQLTVLRVASISHRFDEVAC
jgi:hypothetical protein